MKRCCCGISAGRHLLVLLVGLLALAFTAMPPQAAGLDEPAPTPLQYYAWARSASAEAIAGERARIAEDTLTADPVLTAVQLGLLLCAPTLSTPASDREALTLLDVALSRPATARDDPEYRIFAEFLRSHLHQRIALKEVEAGRIADHVEIDNLQDSNRLLQNKIDALTSIEEQLIQREQGQDP